MEAAARLTAAAALAAPWFSTSATPTEDAAGAARVCSGVNLPTAVPAVTRSPVPEVTRSPVPAGKQAISTNPRTRTSPNSVVSPLPSPARSDSKRRFSKVEKRDSTPSPFSVRPMQVPCSSSASILAASDRPSIAALSRQLSLDERLSFEYGLPRSPRTTASSRTSTLRYPVSDAEIITDRSTPEDLDDALLPPTDELGEIDDISMRSPLVGAGAIPTGLPEEFALLEADATADEFGIDMASAIETWKANQAAGGVADESLDVSRASTVCRGLQGLGLDRKHSELDETSGSLFLDSTAEDQCGQAAWGRGRMHSYSSALTSVGEATNDSSALARMAEREAKPGVPTPSVSALEGQCADDETESRLSSFGSRAAAATTASDGRQPIPGDGEFEGGDLEGGELEHHLNILHMTFLHTLLEDEELSGVQRELVCRHLQGTQQLQAQLQGDDISVAAAAAMADVPMADSAAATALPMPARRAMRASSFPLVTMRNTFSDKRQEPGRRARTDSLTADERIGVLRKGLRTMFREHPKTPLTSEQQTEQQRKLSLPTALCPSCRIAPNQRAST